MSSLALISMAWRNLMRRKSRTFLTIFSVVIGAVAIIMMLSFGYAIQKNATRQMESFMQLTTINVSPRYDGGPSMDGGSPGSDKGRITDKEIKKIKELEHVTTVLPAQYANYELKLKDDRYEIWGGQVLAIDFSLLNEENVTIEEGRLAKNGRKDEVLMGSNMQVMKVDHKNQGMPEAAEGVDILKEKLYLTCYASSGDDFNIGNQNISMEMETVGTYSASKILAPRTFYISFDSLDRMNEKVEKTMTRDASGSDKGMEEDKGWTSNFGPGYFGGSQSQTVKKGGKKVRYYDTVSVQLDDLKYSEDVVRAIQDEMGLVAYANNDFIQEQNRAMQTVQLVFGGLGSIALFVAAIGIANTMLMSIQERIREIGVMKVIGAQVRDIRWIFLFEAMLIGIIGGIIGVFISIGLSFAANSIGQSFVNDQDMDTEMLISFIPIWLPFAAFAFSALIGLISGYLPARKATRVSAIEAIRSN